MGKITRIICAVLCFCIIAGIFLYSIDAFYGRSISGVYYDQIGDIYGSTVKNQGMILQKSSVKRDDNLLIFGSSELGSMQKPFYPVDFFAAKKDGFQVNLIGRGYSQSIIHAINIGALGQDMKSKKMVLIISPQWFTKAGLGSEEFNMNFSELQFYSFMFNDEIDKELKLSVAKRISSLAGGNNEFGNIKAFGTLYSMDNMFSKGLLTILMPYYKFKYHLLSIKDKIKSSQLLNLYSAKDEVLLKRSTEFDWEAEKKRAEEAGIKEASNNEFSIENSYYDTYIKNKLSDYKNSYIGQSYLESPEYEDLRLLFDIVKSLGIEPLIISVPVHGEWYDYCGFDKDDRLGYYEKLRNLVSEYGFDMADFSQYEYEDYFLKDIMHLGWKGWVYVNEAIDKFYHGNQQ
ncbi:hypothetical protein OXPF_35590 [Oxobacter pfennigii]|uniref:Protein DltD n=1 Tax=Oxobacter pfennigii TaxID=36849 RepID=A0A0P8WKF6_9CLOT|nr:D-alanyl-lipoteichoic acid biosynthesis protein DltD [Oxobacter pfennigii]KPU42796.1 hypothetical protein OXPF_35590 [Oxobacter pfennigii]